jgi:hypothetical protein
MSDAGGAQKAGHIRWPWLIFGLAGVTVLVLQFTPRTSPPAQDQHEATGATLPATEPPPPPMPKVTPTQDRIPEKEVEKAPQGALPKVQNTTKGDAARPKTPAGHRQDKPKSTQLVGRQPVTQEKSDSRTAGELDLRGALHDADSPGSGAKPPPPQKPQQQQQQQQPLLPPQPTTTTTTESVSGPPSPGAGDDEAALAKLLPGRFTAEIPSRMRLNVSTHVRVMVSDNSTAAPARPTPGAGAAVSAPVTEVTSDMLVGRLLRVELRVLASEFDILPVTPPEQRLLHGQVSQWEWIVVPQKEGEHELSVVVTNLTDWSGRPLTLKVETVSINVEVATLQKLRALASLASSAFSAMASLVGAWMGFLRPFLLRRREQEKPGKPANEDEKDRRDGKAEEEDEDEDKSKEPHPPEKK